MGIECFMPQYINEKTKQAKPFFPSYLFCKLPLELFTKARNAFGVRGIVHFGAGPAMVPDAVIDSLMKNMGNDVHIQLAPPKFQPGDPIAVTAGPFKGWYGVFDSELSDKGRVKILLDTLHFSRGFHQQSSGLRTSVEIGKYDLMHA